MNFGLVEYLLIAIIAVVMPIWTVMDHRRVQKDIEANVPDARVSFYRKTIVFEWVLTAIVLVVWVGASRSFGSLGFGFENGWGFWVFSGLTLAACIATVVQAVVVARSEEKLAEVKEQLRSLVALIPHNDRDAQWWTGVSITAGICEEIVYRGFMINVFAASMGTWMAVAVSSAVFGLAHSYQGPRGILKTGTIGLVMGALFVMTGSLWAPMLLHVVVDLASGYMGRRAAAHGVSTLPAAA